MVYKFFDKKPSSLADKSAKGSGYATKFAMLQNEKLATELHKPIIKKIKARKVYSSFEDNIWGADLAHMQLRSRFNKRIRLLLMAIDIMVISIYAQVVPLKDKKGVTIVNAFQKKLDSNRKPNKIWVDKGIVFYSRSMKSWLEKNNTEMYSTYNEGKSVAAERFIRTLKTKCTNI